VRSWTGSFNFFMTNYTRDELAGVGAVRIPVGFGIKRDTRPSLR